VIDNTATFQRLLAAGAIALEPAPFLHQAPSPVEPGPAGRLRDRVEGMLLGLAIGDALGATSEGMAPARRHSAHGEVRDYLPHPHAAGRPVGLPTDDTQMAFWALEHILEDDGLDPEAVLGTFAGRRIYGIGATARAALDAFNDGAPWHQAGQPSAGNGALMRIAPVLVAHLPEPSPGLWADTALLAMITHNDPGSTAACLAYVDLLQELLGRDESPAPGWWIERFATTMAPLEGETRYESRTPHRSYRGPIARFVAEQLPAALERDRSVLEACEDWYSGAYLLETVPSFLYILARHGHDPEEAIVRAVNDTRDNDTVAAIVGAAVGALHGADALPARWQAGLPGRTAGADDGRVFELARQAADRAARSVRPAR
jgi:ADP-ribosyl-[dinitrogen reductase] hydrolase